MDSGVILNKIISAFQVIALPVLSGILALAWDTWKKSRAVYDAMFGNPNVKGDDGVLGDVARNSVRIGELRDDFSRLQGELGSPEAGTGLHGQVKRLRENREGRRR